MYLNVDRAPFSCTMISVDAKGVMFFVLERAELLPVRGVVSGLFGI